MCARGGGFTEYLTCGPGWDWEESDETEIQGGTYVSKQVLARYIGRDEVYWSVRSTRQLHDLRKKSRLKFRHALKRRTSVGKAATFIYSRSPLSVRTTLPQNPTRKST